MHAIFIAGETTDLCAPDEDAVREGWARWFNDPAITQWLDHGIFPNTEDDQLRFLESIRRKDRFVLLVRDKAGQLCGVISLSSIKLHSAQISLVVPVKAMRHMALEAMALVTEHAFDKLGVDRVWAGQAYPGLAKWNARLELIGFRTEGVQRKAFAKGKRLSDVTPISCIRADYDKLIELRGHLWPGCGIIDKLIEAQPKRAFAARLADFLSYEQEVYFARLLETERYITRGAPKPMSEQDRAQMLLHREF